MPFISSSMATSANSAGMPAEQAGSTKAAARAKTNRKLEQMIFLLVPIE
jgi:hypothetical protein